MSTSLVLPNRIVHDRRRRRVVEELLDAMRVKAINRARTRRLFWLALSTMMAVVILVAFLARWANYTPDIRSNVFGAEAVYGWVGMHRVTPTLP